MASDSLDCEKRSKRVSSVPVVLLHAPASDDEELDELTKSCLPALSPAKPSFEPSRPPRKSELLHRWQRKLTGEAEVEELKESENLPEMRRDPSLTQAERYTQQLESTTISVPEVSSFRQLAPSFQRIYVDSLPEEGIRRESGREVVDACRLIFDLINIRGKYIFYDDLTQPNPLLNSFNGSCSHDPIPALSSPHLQAKLVDGVYQLALESSPDSPIDCGVISSDEYYRDLKIVLFAMHNVEVKSFTYSRLAMLLKRFEMHLLYNQDREIIDQKLVPHRDFYNIRKIDNHVHLSAAMNQKHLLKFIKKKIRTEPNETVTVQHGTTKTLKEVFEELHITGYELSVDSLNCYADHSTFNRFDRFNSKYSPLGMPVLREIFLKTDNFIKGRYFAELTREVIDMMEREKYLLAEYRVSIYGRNYEEWRTLAQWFVDFRLQSNSVGWLIQIPRLFKVYKTAGSVYSFGDMIRNIFGPIIEATLDPDSHPVLSEVLKIIVGFDTVDDESMLEKVTSIENYKQVKPQDWRVTDNPPYSYWSYYIYANLYVINQLRSAKGLNTFAFRPHCGEAGSHDHLACAFLTAHSVNHGIELRNNPVLQYMFYIQQIGLSMSPLSNNKLFLRFDKNPFPTFLKRGLNVALSTDDPLMIHLTKEPLLEEYSVAAQVYGLSQVDLCEIVRNSILQSGFSQENKRSWLGSDYAAGTPESNDIEKTNHSRIRHIFRYETFHLEMQYLKRCAEVD